MLDLDKFAQLPTDVILQVFDLLHAHGDTHVKEFFLYFPPTRDLVIDTFYKQEVHFIVSPLGRQAHVCGPPLSLTAEFMYYGEIDDFLSANPDIIPRKLLFLTGSDFASLVELFRQYRDRFLKSTQIDFVLEGSRFNAEDLEFVLSMPNAHRLQLAQFILPAIKAVINRCFSVMTNLKVIQLLAHNMVDVSEYAFPASLESLDCSWDRRMDISTVPIDLPHLKEVYLNGVGLEQTQLGHIVEGVPRDLKVLMLSYNRLKSFKGTQLNLEKLDLSYNTIRHEVELPHSLQELNLLNNFLREFHHTANKLTIVNLLGNDIRSLNHLVLPDSVQILDLSGNDIRCEGEFQGFPSRLKTLDLLDNHGIGVNQTAYIQFPSGLETLTMADCGLSSLGIFGFPKHLALLVLVLNNITDMDSYGGWAAMDQLQVQTTGNRVAWAPPLGIRWVP